MEPCCSSPQSRLLGPLPPSLRPGRVGFGWPSAALAGRPPPLLSLQGRGSWKDFSTSIWLTKETDLPGGRGGGGEELEIQVKVHTGSEQSARPLMLPGGPGCGASHDDVSTLLAPGQMLIGCRHNVQFLGAFFKILFLILLLLSN